MQTHHLLLCLVVLVAMSVLVSCGGDDPSGGGGSNDRTPPTVIRTTPEDGDSTVSSQVVVSASFSEPMDAASMTAGTLSLLPAVPGTVGYADSTITFSPTQELDTNTTYTATVSVAAQDAAGNNLTAPYSWQFSTFLDHTPPTVTQTSPVNGDSSVLAAAQVTAVFSEKMDLSSISASSFYLDPATPATVTAAVNSATLQPIAELDTFQFYTATLTTAITDSAGNPLTADYTWSFYTIADTVSPTIEMEYPLDNAVIADYTVVVADADDNDAVRFVEFYADDSATPFATDSTSPYEYLFNATAWDTASVHTIYSRARDRRGNVAASDTITVHFHWRLLASDPNEYDILRNIKAVYERSTAAQVQLRVETYNGWGHYKDGVGGLDCAFYFDTDRNAATGDKETSGFDIGDIGAEYRLIIGLHGDVFDHFSGGSWTRAGDPASLKIQDNSNIFEVAINLSQINYDPDFDIVVVNVNNDDYPNWLWDWVPDTGHRSIHIDATYQPSATSPSYRPQHEPSRAQLSPFK